MASWSDRFFEWMAFITMLAIMISGILTMPALIGEDSPFSSIDTRGNEFAIALNSSVGNMSIKSLFNLGETQSESFILRSLYAIINGVDFLILLSIRIVLLIGMLILNVDSAIDLMIAPIRFGFDILGVGSQFSYFADILYLVLAFGISITILRFAIMIWKGTQ